MANPEIKALITVDDRASKTVKDFGKNVGDAADAGADAAKKAGVALAAVGAGITLIAKNATDFTVDYVKASKAIARETGSTTEEASRLVSAFGRMGISAEDASKNFGLFSKQIQEATNLSGESALKQRDLAQRVDKTKIEIAQLTDEIKKNGDKSGELKNKIAGLNIDLEKMQKEAGDAVNPLQKLNIATKNADGSTKSFSDVLLATADKFKAMADGPEKTAIALELFGRSGKDMIKVLNLGSQGIIDLEKNADKMGLTLNSKTIAAVSAYVESQKQLKDSTDAAKIAIGTATAPVLTQFNLALSQVTQKVMATEGPLKTMTTNVLAFGGPVLAATGSGLALASSFSQVSGKVGLAGAAFTGSIGAVLAYSTGIAYLSTQLLRSSSETGLFSMKTTALSASISGLLPGTGLFVSALSMVTGGLFGNKLAADQVKSSQDALKASTDLLTSAKQTETTANLGVEVATKNYNDAVQRSGIDSLDARLAADHLTQAKNIQKDAHDRTKDAANKNAEAERNVAKASEEAGKKAEENTGKVGGFAGAFYGVADAIESAIGKLLNWNKAPVAQKNVSGGGGGGGGGNAFASGVTNFQGGWAMVGEEGPELVNLPRGSDVIPNDKTVSLMSKGTNAPVGSNTIINVSFSGIFTGNEMEMRKLADKVFRAKADSAGSYGMSLTEAVARA